MSTKILSNLSIFLVIFCFFQLVALFTITFRRNKFPFKNRAPLLVIIFLLWTVIYAASHTQFSNCSVILWARWLNVPILVIIVSLRALHAYSTHHVQQRLLRKENMSFSNWKQFFFICLSKVWVLTAIFATSVLVLILVFALIFKTFRYYSIVNDQYCLAPYSYWKSLLVIDVVLCLLAVLLIIVTWKIDDSLYVKQELKYLSFGFALLICHHISAIIFYEKADPYVWFLLYQASVAFVILIFILPNIYLIWVSFKVEILQRRRSSYDCKEIELSNTNTQENNRSLLHISESSDTSAYSGSIGRSSNISSKVLLDTISIQFILSNKVTREDFKRFLSLEFCAENINFWDDVNEFRLASIDDRKILAGRIIRQYIGNKSRTPVNLSSQAVDAILLTIQQEDTPITLFDDAQSQVVEMLYFAEFPRFLSSEHFHADKP